ncbi:MAG: acyl-CoA reductase [Niabella sp.]
MKLSQRIELLCKLGEYMQSQHPAWEEAKQQAFVSNGWFLPEFINLAVENIATAFLQNPNLQNWVSQYTKIQEEITTPKLVGIVMAGNIPLVGFHDFLCVFIGGHNCLIKTSSKDEVLIKHLIEKLKEWNPDLKNSIGIANIIKGCDAYIATGSNNTAGYFDYYFGKYPHIIRRNRTSVAVLSGNESDEELNALADDIHLYFGMGCRNITKLYLPKNFNFEKLIQVFKKYEYLADIHKYKNNYDYNLAIHVLNNTPYMSTGALLLIEDKSLFSPVSQLHYELYEDIQVVTNLLKDNNSVQCIVGSNYIPFGQAQYPSLSQYADGIDTLSFLQEL